MRDFRVYDFFLWEAGPGLSWSSRKKRGTFGFFVHAGEEVDGIIRSSSGGVLELEDSDDDSTNGEGHAQEPEHEAIHPTL